MKLIVTLKSFEELVSVSCPVLGADCKGNTIVTFKHLGFKNFNIMDGKYDYVPSVHERYQGVGLLVDTEQYEDCYYNEEFGLKLGRWMINKIKRYEGDV